MSSCWHLPPLHALGLASFSTRQAPWGVTFCTSASVSFCQDGQAEASLWREATLLGSDWEQKQQLFMCKMPHMCQAALCMQPLYSTFSWRLRVQKMFCRFFPEGSFSFSPPATSLHVLPHLIPHCFPSMAIYTELLKCRL